MDGVVLLHLNPRQRLWVQSVVCFRVVRAKSSMRRLALGWVSDDVTRGVDAHKG
jgi:hypothetical protein